MRWQTISEGKRGGVYGKKRRIIKILMNYNPKEPPIRDVVEGAEQRL
jgi:hypothetical protein